MTKLAVIIPAFNHLPEVMMCLNSLQALASGTVEVFYHVQDDCSPDVFYPACIPASIASVARNSANGGFGANCNNGAREAITRYQPDVLCLVNQDIPAVGAWSQGWDAALVNAFRFDDPTQQIGIVAPRLLFPTGAVQSAGGTWDQLSQPVHRCLGWTNPHAAECCTAQDVDWATGAVLAVQTSLFEHLGGFDERYLRGYFEDVAFCLRAKEVGARVWYEPACTLIHSVGSTGGSPYFAQNARRFKKEFVDTGKVKPGTLMPTVRYW